MKKVLLPIAILALTMSLTAQSPQKMTYQSVVRNANNELIVGTSVGVRVTILQGSSSGSPYYEESHTVVANDNGLITFVIGDGNGVSGSIASIDWSVGPYFLKIEMDPSGGTVYSIVSTTEMMSVPYALHAENASSVDLSLSEILDVNLLSPTSGDVLNFDGTSWSNVSSSILNPWSVSSGNVYRNSGNVGINQVNPEYPLHIEANGSYGPNSDQSVGISVSATANNTTGTWNNESIRGIMITNNTTGRAISGSASGSNFGVGVFGGSTTPGGQGVSGYAWSSSGDATSHIGVYGEATGDGSGAGTGVHQGVLGISRGAGGGSYGVVGRSEGTGASGYNLGVVGFGNSSTGMMNAGVYGEAIISGATATYGVVGYNIVVTPSGYQTGIMGYAEGNSGENYGIDGTASGNVGTNYGNTGWAFGTGNDNYAIYGSCGTNGSVNYAGYFNGDVHITGVFTNPSDQKLKENVTPLSSASTKVKNLGVYSYTYKQGGLNLPSGLQYGFIAQEVEAEFPELVKEEVGPIHEVEEVEGEDGKVLYVKNRIGEEEYKAVNYIGMIPVLTKAIQEQMEIIEEMKEENKLLKEQLEEMQIQIIDLQN